MNVSEDREVQGGDASRVVSASGLLAFSWTFLLCGHWQRGGRVPLGLFYKDTNPIHGGSFNV